jgi:hypothetical protein
LIDLKFLLIQKNTHEFIYYILIDLKATFVYGEVSTLKMIMEVDERQNERKKEVDQIANDSELDDDGKPKRTGSFNRSQFSAW